MYEYIYILLLFKKMIIFLAVDFANRTTLETSAPVTVDTSPPIKSENPIFIQGRHITSTSEIEAW